VTYPRFDSKITVWEGRLRVVRCGGREDIVIAALGGIGIVGIIVVIVIILAILYFVRR
jgi:hypothetical protein